MFGYGYPGHWRRGAATAITPTLRVLTLSGNTIPENSAAGVVVGRVNGLWPGSSVVLTDTGGGHFALSGGNIVATSTPTDYETAASHSITLTETLAGATGSPKATTITINVVNQNDTNPSAFTLTDQSSIALNTFSSASMTVAGLGASDSVTASFSGDSSTLIRKNAGSWVAGAITGVVNGDVISIGNTSSSSNSTAVNSTLFVGTISDTFTSTTVGTGGALSIVSAPTISGDMVVGQTLYDAYTDTYNVVPDSYSWQWCLDGAALGGETADNILVLDRYVGHDLKLGKVAHKAGYTDSTLNMSA